MCKSGASLSHPVRDIAQQQQTISSHILLSKGAFCTPCTVIRSVTTRSKPTTAQVVQQMKILNEGGVGKFEALSEKEKVFFKLLPTDDNKELLTTHCTNFEEYKNNFEAAIDTKYMMTAQHNRLLLKSPDKDVLMNEYGYKEL